MKKLLLPFLVFLLISFNTMDTQLTPEERKKAAGELTKTENHLLKTVKGLSEAQLNFKSSPDSWSVADCVEHLTISENSFDQMVKGSLEVPSDPTKKSEVNMTDDQILTMISSREKKVKTPESFEPSGKFGTYEETLKAFKSKREEHIVYIETTEEDLRNHYAKFPFATLDAYQVFLFMSGHTERHVKQMEEVMADPNFPKK